VNELLNSSVSANKQIDDIVLSIDPFVDFDLKNDEIK